MRWGSACRKARWLLALTLLSGLAATSSRASAPPATAVPFDVEAVVRRVHFSFREDEGRFTGGHSTYGVEADRNRLTIWPVQRRRVAATVGAKLALDTAVARDSQGLGEPVSAFVDDQGRLVRRAPGFDEVLENRDEGLELSWRFASRPAGTGPLTARVEASGLDYVAETAGGLHFRDEATGLGIRFGQATWVDAIGRRTAVPVRWEGGGIVMDVPRAVIEEASYPAVLDPIIGPENSLDAPVTGPASGDQYSAVTAFDGGTNIYFAAWQDCRAAGGNCDIFATRISAGGTVLDPNGLAVNVHGPQADSPTVVFDGTNFLVVYGALGDIWGRRFNTSGTAVDAVPFAISNHAAAQYQPSASYNGSTTLVVWYDYRNAATGADIYGARVTGGVVTDGAGTGFAISTAAGPQYSPVATFGAGNWLVAWQDSRSGNADIYGARVSGANAAVLDAAGIAISTQAADQIGPRVASNGIDYFVTWFDWRNASTDIYGARVTGAGVVSDASGIQICNDGGYQTYPSVAYGGGTYQVVWEDPRPGLYGNRVSPTTGALLDGPAGARLDGTALTHPLQPMIAATGAGFYLSWSAFAGGAQDVFGSRVTTAPAMLEPSGVVLAQSANGEMEVALAADASNYLVVWKDDRAGATAIFGARVNGSTGLSLDPAGLRLSPASATSVDRPAVAFNGSQYLVVWYQSQVVNRGIYGTRVATTGSVIDPAGLALFTFPPNNGQQPQVASDGVDWLVVWDDGRNFATSGQDVFGGRVSGATGVPIDPSGFPISTAPGTQDRPHVTFGGGYYLVFWEDRRSGTHYDLYGARVNGAGVVQEPTATNIAIDASSEDINNTSTFGGAYGGSNFMVAYTKGSGVRRARVAAATGVVLDTATVACCSNAGADVAYDFDSFLLLYPVSNGAGYDLVGTRISTAGVDLDATDWTVASGVPFDRPTFRIAAASGSIGRALVAYPRYDPTPGVTSNRMRTRLLTRAQSDLSVTKTDGQTTAVPGQPVTYAMTVSNAGPSAALGTSISDSVTQLSGVTWSCVAAGGATCPASGTGSIAHTVDVPVGGTLTYSLTGTISPYVTGTLSNTFTATPPSGFSDPNTSDNSATDTDTLTPQADLSITKTDGQVSTSPGAPITYTIVVSNAGPSYAPGATVTDMLPAGVTGATWTCADSFGFSCGSGSGDISQLVDINPGTFMTFIVEAAVSATATGTLSNTATVTSPGGVTDAIPGNNSATDTDSVIPVNDSAANAKVVLIGSTSSDTLGPAPNDQNWFRYKVRSGRSYCVEVDNGQSDTSIRDTILTVYRANGTTSIDINDDIGGEPGGGLLSRVCYIAPASEDNVARVTAGTNGTPGGFRVRMVETTLFCPWFGPLSSGSGFETFILVKNTTGAAHGATVTLVGAAGAVMGSPQTGVVPADGSYNLQVSAPPPTGFGLSGVSGGAWIAHDGPPGGVVANVTTLNFGSGVSYDTPAVPRLDNRP